MGKLQCFRQTRDIAVVEIHHWLWRPEQERYKACHGAILSLAPDFLSKKLMLETALKLSRVLWDP